MGFDERCFTRYYESGKLADSLSYLHHNYFGQVNAPLYQQAFRWFREKHGLFVEIKCCNTKRINGTFEIEISRLNDRVYGHYGYETYEEAEQSCLDKLIEICKTK